LPVDKQPGDVVIGATLNQTGSLRIEATKVGRDTALAHILRLVEEAQAAKPPLAKLADRIAAYFVPSVIGIAGVTFGLWLVLGPPPALTHALINFVAVLIVACPCALGLATRTSRGGRWKMPRSSTPSPGTASAHGSGTNACASATFA